MFRSAFLLLGLLFVVTAAPLYAADDMGVPQLPQSLGQWYKPANKRQVWLHTMFALRRELQATHQAVAAQDAKRAKAWGQRLLEHYRKLAEMVPEWQGQLDLDEAQRLEQALTEARLEDVNAAARRLARSCRSCHREFRALAAARFRSPDFSGLSFSAADGKQRTHAEQMELLSQTTNGIKIALEDGVWPEASEQLGRLRQELEVLGQGCDTCHADSPPKARILGADTQQQLERLADAIRAQDTKNAEASLGEVAVGVCARCHGVHRTLSDLRQLLFE